jgi:hypothetical protein
MKEDTVEVPYSWNYESQTLNNETIDLGSNTINNSHLDRPHPFIHPPHSLTLNQTNDGGEY